MDIVCFSHLRWDFVYQRPQHLMTRFAKNQRVYYVEEPICNEDHTNHLWINRTDQNVVILRPHLQKGLSEQEIVNKQTVLLKEFFEEEEIANYLFWYYTPMAQSIGNHFHPAFILYDCMDELSNFKFAPANLKQLERELLRKADLVFTGGHNLYQAKKHSHPNIHPFPSSIEKEHFVKARGIKNDPEDQKNIPHVRFGFYGVIDERFNIELLREVAERKPDWHFVILGPVVKIDPEDLPRCENIHYLGSKSYQELPAYLSGWDIAMIPFLLNDSTLYISPTKTPEYLAAGRPVISTSIKDVVTPYGITNLVHIADSADEFIKAAELELSNPNKTPWLGKVDSFLSQNSWDKTWNRMMQHISTTLSAKLNKTSKGALVNNSNKEGAYV